MSRSKGFTLVELMIIAAIVAVLVAVALPKYGDMIEKANVGATIGNLAALRSAVSIYNGNFTHLPETIDPAVVPDFLKVINASALPYVKARHPAGASPYGNGVSTGLSEPSDAGSGWYYNRENGHVFINSTASDTRGIVYSTY